jgi:O-methyltransferase involved in polyketide biosynthesis
VTALATRSSPSAPAASKRADLEPTALYTAGVWAWARLSCAELFDHADARNVFGVVNFALSLARIVRHRAPSLRHSLVQRHVMIDRLLEESGCAQILELAAGLSARGARVTANPDIGYVEVDRSMLFERKRALLARTAEGRAVLARTNLRFVEGDLAELALSEVAPPAPGPLCVIAEGLCMYLDAAALHRLAAQVHALLSARGGIFLFDLVPAIEQPRPGLFGRALGWLMRLFTRGGAFVRDERTRDDIAAELRGVGFSKIEIYEPQSAPRGWQLPHLDRRTQQLVFAAQVALPALAAATPGVPL